MPQNIGPDSFWESGPMFYFKRTDSQIEIFYSSIHRSYVFFYVLKILEDWGKIVQLIPLFCWFTKDLSTSLIGDFVCTGICII